jgi:phospholipase/carboxylesterase
LAEYGAAWAASDRVLIAVHGRDRESDELAIGFLSQPISRVTRTVAPYAAGKSWYGGRYDAPRAENAEAVEAGLGLIDAAFARAAENGIAASNVVLAGFSQGGCMVAEYLLGGRRRPGAAAIFTGSALDVARRGARVDLTGLPVVLSGGDGDPWLPVGDLEATGALLEAAGGDVRLHIFPDGDHVVRDREMKLLGQLVEGVAA